MANVIDDDLVRELLRNIKPSPDETEKERCAAIADRKRQTLKKLEAKRRARGDEAGARRASIGAGIAAQIANEIRCG